ncbi:MAG: efflux RND transporter permease subunit [Tepidisphaeraceae bacterium]|jgi:Cu/Ag efflux pump CusA
MIARIIEFSVRNRGMVIIAWLGIAIWGLYAVLHTPVDAIPDLSENQVIVFADWMGRSPQDIEEQITYPLSVRLQGLAGVKVIRSSSEFNFSMITIIFDEKTDFYFARTRVLERLATAQASMPAGVTPYLAPDATALGQIFWYTVEGEGKSLDELRAIQDWTVRYQLNSIPGVAEVASVGGMVRQYEVDVNPAKLRVYDLPLGALYSAIGASNMSVGGKTIVQANSEYLIRGVGWLEGVTDLENVVVASRNSVPIRLKDVATVQLGPEFRRSSLEKDGREVAGGVVMMRYGENPLAITQAIKDKIRDLQAGLPQGVRIIPFYDRTRLIESAIHTVTGTLREEIIIATIAILLILTHFRSAFVVCLTLPMAALVSFLFMYYLNIPSNIMSLSGIAISIGILVDAAVVMVENATHELHLHFGKEKVRGDTTELVVHACRLVGRPIFFSVVIMLVSFLPIFAFSGQEGKLSHPLAFTKSFAMIGVAIMAVTLVPALIPLFIRGKLSGEEDNWIVRSFINIYKPLLSWIIDRPGFVWWIMGAILSLGAGFIGSELVAALALAAGIIFVVLGVRQTGWTMWVVVLALIATFLGTGLAGEKVALNLPRIPHESLRWVIWGTVAGFLLLAMILRHWRPVAVASLLVVAFMADTRFRKLGGEFMPSLNEGSILDMPTSAPRIAMAQALDDVMVRDRLIRAMPEVEQVVGKVGRADTATDPSPLDMVETIINLHPPEWWPKRKLEFDDALRQGAVVAAEMQKRGWLKSDAVTPADWADVPAAVKDSEYLKFHAKLTKASELMNTAVSVAVEKFDRTMRDLARRRQVEYEPTVAQELTKDAFTAILDHVGHLPANGKHPALLRRPTAQEQDQILTAVQEHGVLLAEVIRQEEVDKLLSQLRADLIARKIASDRDDLLLDAPSPVADAVSFLKKAIGGHTPGFADRLAEQLEKHRDKLWAERTKALNWELFDQASGTMDALLLDSIARTASGTPMAGTTPDNAAAKALRDQLDPQFAQGLFLWQKTKDDVLKEMDSELQMPGWGNAWTQPIINRVNMLATGVRTQIGVKVFGPTGKSLDQSIADIQQISNDIASKLKTVRGAVDVVPDQAVGKRYLEIHIDRNKAARYGVNMSDISEVVETAMGGGKITQTVEGRQRFPVRLRYAREYWQDAEAIGDVLVTARTTPAELLQFPSGGSFGAAVSARKPSTARPTAGIGAQGSGMGSGGRAGGMGGSSNEGMGGGGGNRSAAAETPMSAGSTTQIPLRMVADIRVVEGPSMIKSENGRLRNYVTLNVRDRDIVGFVEEARQAIKSIEASLAGTGMSIEWSGEFEHQVRARQTMAIIFPMVIMAIIFLLYVTFHELLDTLLVFLAVIGALCGSLMFQALFGFNFSVIVSIGYVAAFGMATQTGVIMLVYLREAIDRHGGLEKIASLEDLRRHVIEGAVHRLRPKLLTEGVAIVGLVPMLWATGTGAEIMRPMAAPVLGGLLISDEVIDIMIPVMFYWIRRWRWIKLHEKANAAIATDPPAAAPKTGRLSPA